MRIRAHPTRPFGRRRRRPAWPLPPVLGLAMLLVAGGAFATACPLTLQVSGVIPGSGPVLLALFDQVDAFPTQGEQWHAVSLRADAPDLSIGLCGVPAGRYAVAAFQDVNHNRRLDVTVLGIPREPYGFGNDARGVLDAFPPGFRAASLVVRDDGPPRMMRITLRQPAR